MESFRGKILDEEKVVLEGVEGELFMDKDAAGITSWSGQFELPFPESIQPDATYTLALDDGRKGQIIVTRMHIDTDTESSLVRFQGSGALEQD